MLLVGGVVDPAAVAHFAPLIVAVVLLLAGCFPGETTFIEKVRAGRPARRAVACRPACVLSRRSGRLLPRGGSLIATAIATRPPPVAESAH